MKKLAALALLWTLSLSLVAQDDAAPVNSPSEVDYSPLELLELWGWFLGQQYTLDKLVLSADEMDAIKRGMANYANGVRPTIDVSVASTQLEPYIVGRLERIERELVAENKRKELVFMDSLIGEPNIRSLATGLFFEIIEPGGERKPLPTDRVKVHYEGKLLDGRIFDSSYERKEPSTFKLNEVITAWTQGVPLIGVGGKVKLYSPSGLAYGDESQPGLPPAATMIFEIELLEILDDEPKPATPSLSVE